MSKIRKKFMLSDKSLEYIKELKESRDLKYVSDALEVIINDNF